jgi:3-methyladenine DNA glycosylase AlkD
VIAREVSVLRARLQKLADPRAIPAAQAVYRCGCGFRGVSMPRIHLLAREVVRRHRRGGSLERVVDLARAFWKSPWHEEKVLAVHLAAAAAPQLDDRHWTEFRRWVEGAGSSGHADAVAVHVLGRMVERDRAWLRVLCHWARSPKLRMRRAALGAVLLRTRHMGDVEAAFAVCEPLMADRAAAVREAAAVVLREALESDARATRGFLDRWKGRAPASLISSILG